MRWDVFCRVVDNYGDAAVCWRLARQLATEHGASVRLWIDRPETLHALQPGLAPSTLSVHAWHESSAFGTPADVAVDAFDAGLPPAYAAAMPASALWTKLEYLSAESWVEEHHGLPSPHPTLPVRRYFFFPGFTPRTGGLLREADLFERRDAFDAGRFWQELGHPPSAPGAPGAPDETTVSLFGYANAAVAELLRCWSEGERPVTVAVAEGPLKPAVATFLGGAKRRGRLQARFLPFLPQARYDELLWACDWNFVRGEDSFVRAQWAARPFVWHIYPQHDGAHRAKLDAFLAMYCAGLGLEAPLGALWRAWNGGEPGVADAWVKLGAHEDTLRAHASAWAARLGSQSDLAGGLAQFAENLLK